MSRENVCRRICLSLLVVLTCTQIALGQQQQSTLTWQQGAIVRGDSSSKRIALVFTGGDYGEGTSSILKTLQDKHVKAGLFVTGGFLRNREYRVMIQRAIRKGHYVGPHSDQHLLYCSWQNRDESLVTREQFASDLQKNIRDLKALGATFTEPIYFIPPYEWFNRQQSEWATQMQVQMFNYTPGSRSNRDYIPEGDSGFLSSNSIMEGILEYEKKTPNGLNGHILLLHLGSARRDKPYLLVGGLIDSLRSRGYTFVRIDSMLNGR